MTTIIGLKAEKGPKVSRGILIGSDETMTREQEVERGDVKYKVKTTHQFDKLYTNRGKNFVIGVTGTINGDSTEFYNNLLKGKHDLQKIIAEKKFPAFRELNVDTMGTKDPILDKIGGFLLATRFDNKTKLYRIWPMGDVNETPASAIGSGADYAIERMGRKLTDDRKSFPYVTMNYASKMMDMGLTEAEKDIYSGGLDVVLVRPGGIIPFGREIKKRMKATRKGIFDHVRKAAAV